MKSRSNLLAVGVVAACCAQSGFAAVTFYDAFKTATYVQDSPAQPTTAIDYRFDARIFADTPGDVSSGTVVTPLSQSLPLTGLLGLYIEFRDDGFASTADVEVAYPAGTYTYSIDTGTLAPASTTLTVDAPIYPETVPFFSPATFATLNTLVPGVDAPVSFNSFAPVAGAMESLTFFTVFDGVTGQVLYGNFGPTITFTGDTIPGALIQPEETYLLSLAFSSRYAGAGTLGSESSFNVGFDRVTDAQARAVPEPGALACVAAVGLILVRRRATAL